MVIILADFRKQRTQKAIQTAFLELMNKYSFEKISVTMIVKRAMINRNTFYLHYADKYDLLKQLIAQRLDQIDLDWQGFIKRPFTTIGRHFKFDQGAELEQKISKQRDSSEFRRIWFNGLLQAAIKNLGTTDEFWFLFGKIQAIVQWNEFHGEYFNILQDYQELEKIYETERFPKLKWLFISRKLNW